ncbi:MAG: PfkB family carbohydrate kinase [Pseudoflavonifractor sp.]|nr:PfkB family carbohydrate kinase [Pseudoflavonifractor sp.]
MRKIIAIGRCGLDIVMEGGKPVDAYPGGRILNAAATLGDLGHHVTMVGEAGRDSVGDMVVTFLECHGVDVRSIDRFTEGTTPTSLVFNPEGDVIDYADYPDSDLDVVWPRIDRDDIVLFGTAYAVDPRVRRRLFEIVSYAAERGAVIIYLPGFTAAEVPRITKVMPAVFENLELADMVVTRTRDLSRIFETDDVERAYRDHVGFYCPAMINLDPESGEATLFVRERRATVACEPYSGNPTIWNAGAVAGIIDTLMSSGITRRQLDSIGNDILSNAVMRATATAKPGDGGSRPEKVTNK